MIFQNSQMAQLDENGHPEVFCFIGVTGYCAW